MKTTNFEPDYIVLSWNTDSEGRALHVKTEIVSTRLDAILLAGAHRKAGRDSRHLPAKTNR